MHVSISLSHTEALEPTDQLFSSLSIRPPPSHCISFFKYFLLRNREFLLSACTWERNNKKKHPSYFFFISFIHSRNSLPGSEETRKNLKIETQYIASTQNSDNSGYRATAVSLQLTIHRPINKPFTIRHSSCLHIYHRALPRPLLDRIPAVTREVVPELMVVGIPVGIGKFSSQFLISFLSFCSLLLPLPRSLQYFMSTAMVGMNVYS